MRKILSLVSLGAIASIQFFPLEANAIPFNSNTVYKALNNATPVIVFSGTPNNTITFSMVDNRPTSRIVGACGEIRLSPSTMGPVPLQEITVNNVSVPLNNLTTHEIPSCTNGQFNSSVPTNFRTPQGGIVLGGRTPGSAVAVLIPKAVPRTVEINACGFGLLRNPPATFTFNGTERQYSSLPDAGQAPRCINNSGFVPAAWP
jgi:hypothetical protein